MTGTAMKMPRWWPVRKARQVARQAEADADRAHRELVAPLRAMREDDRLTEAVQRDVTRWMRRQGGPA